MRTLRVLLVGTATLASFGGLGGVAMAQDEEGVAAEPSGVVVTMSDFAVVSAGDWMTENDQPFASNYGVEHTYTWEATDPRLGGAATYRGKWHGYEPLLSQLEAFEWTVDNDAGSWTGTGYGIFSADAAYGDAASVVLTGDGAYEGLTAYLNFDIAHEEGIGRGLIIADEMPPFPEPPLE